MASKVKVLTTGGINGKFTAFFARVAGLHAKNGFAFGIITGDSFADAETASENELEELAKLLGGEITVPLTMYFGIGHRALPDAVTEKLQRDDGELCSNLFALGRKGRMKTSEGLKIVTLGGTHHDGDEAMDSYSALYTDHDATAAKGHNDADILLTSDWPAAVRVGSRRSYTAEAAADSQAIAELCVALKPRYHFSMSPNFFEREPFFHNLEPPRPITRFVSLAPYDCGIPRPAGKDLYAFSIEPSAAPSDKLPEDATASPFHQVKKRKLESQQEPFDSFRYSNGNGHTHTDSYRPRGGKRRRGPAHPASEDECYFCLKNPAFSQHMVGSLATEAYLATAKGPLTTRSTFPELGFPGHILIIPIDHAPTVATLPAETRDSTAREMHNYRDALHAFIARKSQDPSTGKAKLGAVTWEISRTSGVHLQWQFLPVPVDLINRGLIEAGFKAEAENCHYPTTFATSASDIAEAEEGDYFKVMIWSEGLRKEIVLPLNQEFRFDLQFGRRVLGKLLKLEQRTHWKDCQQTRPEEEADAEKLKEGFGPFDFSMQ